MSNSLSDVPMTPQERAEKFIPGWSSYTQLACKAIEEAIAAERARVAAERALPGAPLTEERGAEIKANVDRLPATGEWFVGGESGLMIHAIDPTDDPPWEIASVYSSIGYGLINDKGSRAVAAFIADARQAIPALLADRTFLRGLIRDLGEDDPGKLAQWQSGRLFGINEGLEEAAKKVEEVCLAGAKEQLAANIRALKRPTL